MNPPYRRTRSALLAVATLAAGAALSGADAHGAHAATSEVRVPGLSVVDQDRIARQRPLVAAASAIRWEVERHSHTGYAGIVLEDSRVVLWWKGGLPSAMARVVAQASRTAPVAVRPAAYSIAELRAAASALQAQRPVGRDAVLRGIKLQPDGSGLIVVRDRAAHRSSYPALPAVGVPVTVVDEAPLETVSRDDDWAPWKGGATNVNTDQGTACTAGFGVHGPGGGSYILTAAHCGQQGQRIQDGAGEYIGNVGPRHQDHDVELIPTYQVDGYVYVGSPTDNVVAPVEGWGWTFVGEYLCQSGVTSSRHLGGPVCNLKVLFYWADREDLVEAEQTEGRNAARPGDSGGPIYSVSGSGKLIAKGTVTRTAGPRLGFQDYGTAWRDFGITPATR
jgi:hypothetical protein